MACLIITSMHDNILPIIPQGTHVIGFLFDIHKFPIPKGHSQIFHVKWGYFVVADMCWILIDWRTDNSSPLDKTDADIQTSVSRAFSWMKSFSLQFQFHSSCFPRAQLIIRLYWFRELLGAGQVPRHFLNHKCPSSPPHICGTRGRWVKTLICTWKCRLQKSVTSFRSKCVKSYLIIPPFRTVSNNLFILHPAPRLQWDLYWQGLTCTIPLSCSRQ